MKKLAAVDALSDTMDHVEISLILMRRLRRARYTDGDRAHALIETIIDDLKPKLAMMNELLELLDEDEVKRRGK